MRESIGGAMMLRIFLVVIVIFVVFLCVSANFARAFRVKNGVITIIEQYEGINSGSIPKIQEYVSRMGYSCTPIGFDGTPAEYVVADNKLKDGKKEKVYNVQVCVDWNFPVIDAAGTWNFTGKTELIKDVVE